jgi:hypothetical protein
MALLSDTSFSDIIGVFKGVAVRYYPTPEFGAASELSILLTDGFLIDSLCLMLLMAALRCALRLFWYGQAKTAKWDKKGAHL